MMTKEKLTHGAPFRELAARVADIELRDVPADRFADLATFAESIALGRKS